MAKFKIICLSIVNIDKLLVDYIKIILQLYSNI